MKPFLTPNSRLFKLRTSLGGLGAALTTLTVIPWFGKESGDLADSLPWFPVIGLFLGFVLYCMGLLFNLLPVPRWPEGIALLLVAAGVWLTRGLHLDGLADWADSIGGTRDRRRRLAIMKDVSLGAFGVLAVVLALLAKWVAFGRLLSCGSTIWIPLVFVVSRGMMVELITTLPYARSEEGMGGPFVEGACARHRVISHCLSLALCLPLGPAALGLYFLGWIETRIYSGRIERHFGGVTGDLLGTANEMIEISLLMICALPGDFVLCYTGWAWLL